MRARLPASPPEQPEPFADVLRDLDEVLLPGLTHWQSPRFFAYFATTGSEPGILAELLSAGLNQVGILWRTSPALQELEEVTLDWLAQLLGLPAGLHGHIEDTASTGDAGRARRGARREARAPRRRLLRARALLGREGGRLLELEARAVAGRRRVPAADGRARPRRTPARSSRRSGRPRRARSTRCRRSPTRCEAAGVWLHVDAAYAGSAAVCPELRDALRRLGARRLDRRQPAQVAVRRRWTARRSGRAGPTTCARRSASCRSTCASARRWRACASTARCSAAASARSSSGRCCAATAAKGCRSGSARRSGSRRCSRAGCATSRAGSSPRRGPFSLVCFRRDGSDEENEALLERVNATGEVFLSHTKLNGRYVLRLAIGNARTTEDDVRLAWDVLRREAASGVGDEAVDQPLEAAPDRPRSARRRAAAVRRRGS